VIFRFIEAAGLTDEGGKLPDVLSGGIHLDDATNAFESVGVPIVTNAIEEEDCPAMGASDVTVLSANVGCNSDNHVNIVPVDEEDTLPEAYHMLLQS
jgi:hypothetical protein